MYTKMKKICFSVISGIAILCIPVLLFCDNDKIDTNNSVLNSEKSIVKFQSGNKIDDEYEDEVYCELQNEDLNPKYVFPDVGTLFSKVIGLNRYDITISNKGSVYFADQVRKTESNNTPSNMKLSSEFIEKASVKSHGSIACESKGQAKVNSIYGFKYNFSGYFSINIKTTIESKKSLQAFIRYQKIEIKEDQYRLDKLTRTYEYVRTRTKTVYKPTGLYFNEVEILN